GDCRFMPLVGCAVIETCHISLDNLAVNGCELNGVHNVGNVCCRPSTCQVCTCVYHCLNGSTVQHFDTNFHFRQDVNAAVVNVGVCFNVRSNDTTTSACTVHQQAFEFVEQTTNCGKFACAIVCRAGNAECNIDKASCYLVQKVHIHSVIHTAHTCTAVNAVAFLVGEGVNETASQDTSRRLTCVLQVLSFHNLVQLGSNKCLSFVRRNGQST